MFLVIHTLLGFMIGLFLPFWLLVFLISFASHFLLDIIPHWDGEFNQKNFYSFGKVDITKSRFFLTVFDLIASFTFAFVLYQFYPFKLAVLGFFASILPDLLSLGYFTPLKKNRIYIDYLKFHSRIQNETSKWVGILFQVLIFIFLLIILLVYTQIALS